MSMTCSQEFYNYPDNPNGYDDTITITDVPKGQFPAVTAMGFQAGSTTREITVTIMSLDAAPGGTQQINSGLYLRGDSETAVKTTVYNVDGKEACSCTKDYS